MVSPACKKHFGFHVAGGRQRFRHSNNFRKMAFRKIPRMGRKTLLLPLAGGLKTERLWRTLTLWETKSLCKTHHP
jgi:hypothetical protein